MEKPDPAKSTLSEGHPKIIVELKELDEVYSRFRNIFVLTNILTIFLSGYVIAWLIFEDYFNTDVFPKLQKLGICVILTGLVLLCVAQWLFMRYTTQRSRRKIQELTFKDALTSVFNYRYLDQHLDQELRVAKRFHATISIVYMDLDKFKRVNDECGHQFGNAVLSEVGNFLRVTSRASDLVGRMGGDEFLMLLPNTSRDEAQIVAERLRRRMENHGFEVDGRKVDYLTASMGVAAFPLDAQDKEGLITAADQAMYRAKQSGGNRICI